MRCRFCCTVVIKLLNQTFILCVSEDSFLEWNAPDCQISSGDAHRNRHVLHLFCQDVVIVITSCGGCLSDDRHPWQRGQLQHLHAIGGAGQRGRGLYGVPAGGLRLHRLEPRGNAAAVRESGRWHHQPLLTPGQVRYEHRHSDWPPLRLRSCLCVCLRKLDVWLSLGGFHERGHDWKTDRRIYNSHIILNGQGT